MKNKQLELLRILFIATDFLLLNTCLLVALYLAQRGLDSYNVALLYKVFFPINSLWLMCSIFFQLYNSYTICKIRKIYKATWRSSLSFFSVFLLYKLATSLQLPPNFLLIFYSLLLFFLLSRYLSSYLLNSIKVNFDDHRASIVAIASVGGHWIELLRLMPLFKNHDVAFVSNKANLANTVDGNEFYVVPDANRSNPIKLAQCFLSVIRLLVVIRPGVIITTGAAPGLMAILVGRVMGIKTIWIDSIANVEQLSLSGEIASRIADKVYTQWGHLSGSKVTFEGSVL